MVMLALLCYLSVLCCSPWSSWWLEHQFDTEDLVLGNVEQTILDEWHYFRLHTQLHSN